MADELDIYVWCGHAKGESHDARVVPDYHPLTEEQVFKLVSLHDERTDENHPDPQFAAFIWGRLHKGIPGMTCPRPQTGPLFVQRRLQDLILLNRKVPIDLRAREIYQLFTTPMSIVTIKYLLETEGKFSTTKGIILREGSLAIVVDPFPEKEGISIDVWIVPIPDHKLEQPTVLLVADQKLESDPILQDYALFLMNSQGEYVASAGIRSFGRAQFKQVSQGTYRLKLVLQEWLIGSGKHGVVVTGNPFKQDK